ncbi:helix-turn-helix domain-containing protein [Qipengyuania pacifica]|uniref:helix-turn-helix domain-containing protein n=1 Tax=Qipengyuania pacifica TaxID=2860199 RepID=UPI001C9DFB07|nr:helix-turn-helix domain-containing protein [Qipengyuania pacifica]MBY8333866.1 helix-turn-helix domain-containing protein [Qipengyuania pacifica]
MLRGDIICGAAAAAKYTGLEVRTIYGLCAKDYLPYVRLGHRLFFRKSELDATFAGASQRRDASSSGSQFSVEGRVA